jgi:tetratricopeptide (TPR) repeat protein
MKKANNWFLFLLIGILFFPSFSFSQQNDIDSLENIIATTTVDSQKVKAKYTLYKKIIRKDFAKAERLVQEGFALSKKINWNWGIGNGLLQLATIHYYKGELALGVEKIKASIAIFNQIGADISPMITNLAAFYQAQGQIDSAEYYYLQAIDAFQATNQVANSLIVLNNLSAIYSKKGQYKKALKIYEDAKTKALSIGDSTIAYSLNSNIANSHLDLGNYAKAIERFSENLSYYEQIGDIDRQALTLSNIGGTYLEWKETQKALTFFERALVIRQKIGHPPTISKSLLATADAQYELGNYALALPKLEQALAIQEKVKDKSVRANILKSLAKNQLKLGQYKKGLKNLQIAEKEALALKEHLLLAEIYLNYADLYSQPDLGFEIEKSIDIEDILQKAKASIDKTDDLEGQQRIYTALTKWANKNQQYQTG